jgi:hypothetical protein
MLLSLYSLLLRAVFQPLASDMGALQMTRYARMAVPLANPLLAGARQRSYMCCFGQTSCARRAHVPGQQRKGFFPAGRVSIEFSPRDRGFEV